MSCVTCKRSLYSLDIAEKPPYIYSPSDSFCFWIGVTPWIENATAFVDVGKNRIWMTLEDLYSSNVFKSNYVEFVTSDTGLKKIAFGGAVPDGTYDLTLYMRNTLVVCTTSVGMDTCVCKNYECYVDNIEVTTTTSTRAMHIDYFSQVDCDLLQTPNLELFLNNAFKPANTNCSLFTQITNLSNEDIVKSHPSSVPNLSSVPEFIENTRTSYGCDVNDMFLCGVAGFVDSSGTRIPNLFGIAWISQVGDYYASNRFGSLVGVESISNYSESHMNMNKDECILGITVHEMGHQRGVRGHHVGTVPASNWNRRFCLMHESIIFYYNETIMNRIHINSAYINPFFCDECLEKIRNFPSWGGKK